MPKPVQKTLEAEMAQLCMGCVKDHVEKMPHIEEDELEIEITRVLRHCFLEASQHVRYVSFPEHDTVPDMCVHVGEHDNV